MAALTLLLIPALPAFAQSPAVAATAQPPPPCWDRRVAIGGQAKGGNAESFHIALGLDALRHCGNWQWALDVHANITAVYTSAGRRDFDDYELDFDLHRQFHGNLYIPARVKFEITESSGHNLKAQAGLGLGVKLHQTSATTWTLESGGSMSRENRVAPQNETFPSIFFLTVLERRISDHARLIWRNDLKLNLERSTDWESDQEVEVLSKLVGRVSLKVDLEWEHDSRPPPGIKRNDYQTSISLAISI
jgi:putative salt-induced outer membrane protein YdiY